MRSRTKHLHLVYWAFTLLFVLPQGWSAIQYLLEAPRMTATIAALGYPEYVMPILGVAKLLGIAAILSGVSPTLKEWAYAGFTIDVCGAIASHLSVGDSIAVVLVPIVFFVVQLLSYFTWKRLRADGHRRRRSAFGMRSRESRELDLEESHA